MPPLLACPLQYGADELWREPVADPGQILEDRSYSGQLPVGFRYQQYTRYASHFS